MVNKRLNITLAITAILILALVSIVLAAGVLPYDRSGSKVPIQNISGISADAAGSRCDRFAAKTKGILKVYSGASGNYRGLCYSVTDDAGTAIPVKRRTYNGAAGLVKSSDCIAVNGNMASVAFDSISAAARNHNVCIERQ